MLDDWKKLQVPLGLLASLVVAIASAYGWARSELVWAADFQATVQTIQEGAQSMEVRSLERDKRKTELEILKLRVKQQTAPQKFDAVDKAILDAHQEDLKELKKDIREVKTRGLTK